jgi:hypothetical protein
MARFVRFLILGGLCSLLVNLAFGEELAAPFVNDANSDENPPPTITISEAGDLINLLPATKELRAKGMDVRWDVQANSTMNNRDYYFFWIYNATAQKERDIGSISVGNYAVNKHTADVRVWLVSYDIFHGDDGILVTTKGLSCWKDSDHLISRLGHSATIYSSAGYRAYVEVKATAFRPKYQETYTGPLCENTSRLFLAGPGDAEFKLAYSQSADFSDGNSLKLVDWSPDGVFLLMERASWKYESEGDYTDLVLFNPESRSVTVPDLSKILEGRFGADCGSENSVIGFTPEGNVAILVNPVEDTYYNEGATSCVKQKTLLALDANRALQDIAQVLPSDFEARRYGLPPKGQASRK